MLHEEDDTHAFIAAERPHYCAQGGTRLPFVVAVEVVNHKADDEKLCLKKYWWLRTPYNNV